MTEVGSKTQLEAIAASLGRIWTSLAGTCCNADVLFERLVWVKAGGIQLVQAQGALLCMGLGPAQAECLPL
jgi:hypothetical protein